MGGILQEYDQRRVRGMKFLPTTRSGRAAMWLAAGFVVWFFVLNSAIVVLRQHFDLLPQQILIAQSLLGLLLGLVASAVALVAILRKHERSISAFLALLPGALVIMLLIGELVFPH
jgi:uncharacterized membrane protein YhaH (DUF805 family)